MNCLECNKIIESKPGKKFCSRSCAATYNNKLHPKKKLSNKCKTCGCLILSTRSYCNKCINTPPLTHGGPRKAKLQCSDNYTIEEVVLRTGSNRYDRVRANARIKYKDELSKPRCEKCSYNKHVELCHIKPISSFPKNTTLDEVNARNNIMLLCPNCHWEYDNGVK